MTPCYVALIAPLALIAGCEIPGGFTHASGAAAPSASAAASGSSAPPAEMPSATAPASVKASVQDTALRFMRAVIACDKNAAMADVGNDQDAHEIMTRELDRTEVDEEAARFLDKQCKRLGGAHKGEVVDAHVDGARHLSSKQEHYLVRDVDIVAVTVSVRADGRSAGRVTLHFFETSRGWRFTPRP
jgi:hypothetical protein